MPVKNEAGRPKAIVENLLLQTYRPVELLFVDGGSTDGTREAIMALAEEHSSGDFIIRLLKEEDYGLLRSPANARNIGIASARGNYLAFFDADFYLEDKKTIEGIVEGLRQNDHIAITYIPNAHTWIERNLAVDDRMYYFQGKKHLHIVCGFRKDVFDRETFDPGLGFREDFEFLRRARTKYEIVETEVRRCYPHTLTGLVRQQLWYGRTVLRYFMKAHARFSWLSVVRSNAVLGLLVLCLPFILLNTLVSSTLACAIIFLIVYRWLRRESESLSPLNYRSIKGLVERLAWLFLRETLVRFSFDLGLVESIIMKEQVQLGR